MSGAPAEPRRRWRIEIGGRRTAYTKLLTLGEAQDLIDKMWPAPCEARLSAERDPRETYVRQGGEPHDGGGYQPVEWESAA